MYRLYLAYDLFNKDALLNSVYKLIDTGDINHLDITETQYIPLAEKLNKIDINREYNKYQWLINKFKTEYNLEAELIITEI